MLIFYSRGKAHCEILMNRMIPKYLGTIGLKKIWSKKKAPKVENQLDADFLLSGQSAV